MQGEQGQMQAVLEDVTALNEELLDKLKLLNYEKDFLQGKGNKPINVASFSIQGNPSQQFNMFKNLVKWLFQLNDIPSGDFSKYDDPLTVSTNILNQCKKLQIPAQYPPLKLKTGSGDQVVSLLNQLAGKALKKKNFTYKIPKFEAVKNIEEQREEEPKGDDDDMIDQAEIAEQDDLDDKQQIGTNVIDDDKQIINSAINENDWKLECQRVGNKLKIQAKQDNKEWRAHIDSSRTCGQHIKKNFPKARSILQKLNEQLTKSLEKISKSQKMINANMSDMGDIYKNQSEELKKLSSHYNNLNTSIKEMNQNYRLLSEKLQQIQTKIDQHSGTMTDSSPVVKIKQSLMNITKEIKSMDVMTGVLSHTILQYKAKERTHNTKAKNNHIEAEEFDEF